MLYIFISAATAFAVLLIIKLLTTTSLTDYSVGDFADDDAFRSGIRVIAQDCRNAAKGGVGLSFSRISKTLSRGYAVVSQRVHNGTKCYDFELKFYDNYHNVLSTMGEIRQAVNQFKKLPHTASLPNIYKLCTYIVKSSSGYVTPERLKLAADIYSMDVPLTATEVMMLNSMLKYCIIEYASIFAAKICRHDVIRRAAIADAKKCKINVDFLRYDVYASTVLNTERIEFKSTLKKKYAESGLDIGTRLNEFAIKIAGYSAMIESSVRTLYEASNWFGGEYTLSLSPTLQYLTENDTSIENLTMDTKFAYLNALHFAARKKGISEIALAAKITAQATAENKDISHYIYPKKLNSKLVPLISVLSVLLGIGLSIVTALLIGLPVSIIQFFIVTHIISEHTLRILAQNRQKFDYPQVKVSAEDKLNTAIICCRLAKTESEYADALANMQTVMAANRGFSYGLVLDAPPEVRKRIQEIHDPNCGIFVVVRSNAYERKRGAILQFNDLVLSNNRSPFDVMVGEIKSFEYVITLDADNQLTDAEYLLRVMRHPFAHNKNVLSLPMRPHPFGTKTLFFRLTAGQTGIDRYSSFTDNGDILFGLGNYTGKGIYRVRQFNELTVGAFADNRILSHDLIEGAFVGCGTASISGMDDYPANYSEYLARQMRWYRGDVQLLPFVRRKYRNKNGQKTKVPIDAYYKRTILRNSFLPLVSVVQIALMIIAAFSANPLPILLIAFAGEIINFLLSLSLVRVGILPLLKCTAASLFHIMCLPTYALSVVAAFCLTIVRLITKRNLLQWTTFAHTKNKKLGFFANYIIAALFITLALIPLLGIWQLALGVIFACAPIIDCILSRKEREVSVSDKDKAFMTDLAAKTWNYFAQMPDYKLPPDNEAFGGKWADRSSPSDIAFAITSAISAFYMGIIDRKTATDYTERLITEIDKLPKIAGLPYNWYRASDGKPLNPRYISSVDCGNLLAALVLAQSILPQNATLQKLINQMDFNFLYDTKRKLLVIGYNADEKRFDAAHYDLLGSEAVMTYLLCVGYGKLPAESYYNLATTAFAESGGCLASWTGGMFEYLMPLLFLDAPKQSLFSVSAKNVIKTHIKRARALGTPIWGRSESLYADINDGGDYSYSAFGHSEIALSNKIMRNVSAPYASIITLGASKKYAKMFAGMLGSYVGESGLPDAVDYDANKVIDSRMTHHQGMIMAALCIAVGGDRLRKSLLDSPEVRAAKLHMCLGADTLACGVKKQNFKSYQTIEQITEFFPHELAGFNYLTNGRYTTVIDENGKGFSRNRGLLLSRYDTSGGLELTANGVSMTSFSQCVATTGVVSYKKSIGEITSTARAYVLADFDAEIREIELLNSGSKPQEVTFTAAIEPCLREQMADISHKAFSSLFVTTADGESFVCARRKNSQYLGLALSDKGAKYCGSKQKFLRSSGLSFGNVVFPKLYGTKTVTLNSGDKYTVCVAVLASNSKFDMKKAVDSIFSDGYLQTAVTKSKTMANFFKIMPTYKQLGAYIVGKHMQAGGRLPLVVVRAVGEEQLSADLKQLGLLRMFGIEFEVAVLYRENYGYKSDIADFVGRALLAYGDGAWAHNEIYADKATLKDINKRGIFPHKIENELLLPPQKSYAARYPTVKLPMRKIEYSLGMGGFTRSGYYVCAQKSTPAPWSNVIANQNFGTVITSNGGGFTFADNSYMRKLSVWSGDEFADTASEGIVLGDKGAFWSITRSPINRDCDYAFEHSVGKTSFMCGYNGVLAKQSEYIDDDTKYFDVTLIERAGKKREIDILFYVKLVLGDFVQRTAGGMKFSARENILTAKYGAVGASITSTEKIKSHSFYTESFMRDGNVIRVKNLESCGATPCLAMSTSVTLPSNGKMRVIFSLSLKEKPLEMPVAKTALLGGGLQPFMLSDEKPYGYYLKWLLAQTYYARFNARCGFQQVSGAYGFRDQLQDCLALLYTHPHLVREHIIKCAQHQFTGGDVMHWWHEPSVGVRTKICDDRLFLPYVVSEYISFTGDGTILTEKATYLEDVDIPQGAHSVYDEMKSSDLSGTIYEHCVRAINSVQLSDRGLVLMGGGDWNDGMDRVGIDGKGESVWCSMFLYFVVKKFLPLATKSDSEDFVVLMSLLRTAAGDCYEGDRYTRAIMDDGTVLGSKDSVECKIDLISQSWAMMSGIVVKENAKIALNTAYSLLVDENNGIIKLLDNPFKKLDVGYIADYPQGVRENGGQYSHAAVWFIRALYEAGDYDRAEKLLEMILPSSHARTESGVEKYRQEPYVLAGDVYAGRLSGQGGWSWYTGSAGWLYKTLIEYHYGITISSGNISFAPKMIGCARLTINMEEGTFNVVINRTSRRDMYTVRINDLTVQANSYSLKMLTGKTVYIS